MAPSCKASTREPRRKLSQTQCRSAGWPPARVRMVRIRRLVPAQILRGKLEILPGRRFAIGELGVAQPVRIGLRRAVRGEDDAPAISRRESRADCFRIRGKEQVADHDSQRGRPPGNQFKPRHAFRLPGDGDLVEGEGIFQRSRHGSGQGEDMKRTGRALNRSPGKRPRVPGCGGLSPHQEPSTVSNRSPDPREGAPPRDRASSCNDRSARRPASRYGGDRPPAYRGGDPGSRSSCPPPIRKPARGAAQSACDGNAQPVCRGAGGGHRSLCVGYQRKKRSTRGWHRCFAHEGT